MRRTKNMKAILHWVQYVYHISVDTIIINLNEVMFIHQSDTALHRAIIRQNIIDQLSTKSKEASPVPLESDKKRKEWYSKLINDLSTLIGGNVVPLSFVVRQNDNPYSNGGFPNFIDKTI